MNYMSTSIKYISNDIANKLCYESMNIKYYLTIKQYMESQHPKSTYNKSL